MIWELGGREACVARDLMDCEMGGIQKNDKILSNQWCGVWGCDERLWTYSFPGTFSLSLGFSLLIFYLFSCLIAVGGSSSPWD